MKKYVISDILKWIEKNINNEIRIDDIVNISGYSRRSIQYIFKEYTGLSLGVYIRQRKLCRSAVLLKLTNLSILNISMKMGFDSQASFSREFKKFFNDTPNNYRKKTTWDLKKFRAAITLNENNEIIPSFRYLNDNRVFGYQASYQEYSTPTIEYSDGTKFKFDIIKSNMLINNENLFVYSNFKPSEFHHDMVDINCFVAFEDATIEKTDRYINGYTYYDVPGGLYAKFSYKGNWDDFILYSRKIYIEVFPMYGLNRRSGDDIEMFYYNDTILEGFRNVIIECDYYIPIS